MAITDLTNLDPYAENTRQAAQFSAQNSQRLQGVFDQISNGIQAGQQRRQLLTDRNRATRDREYAIANQATDQLVQANTNNKYTDVQLQEVGRGFKQEFYDAVKTYEQSDKGDEARQAFEGAKQKSLGSARTIGASIEKLGTQMDSFKDQVNNGGISDSMNPAIRSFFNDLNDPETPADAFKIVTDEETGQLKYQGTTSDGHDVDFFLDDLANGENDFAPVPAADMPEVINNLLKGVSKIRKQEQRDWGVVESTDWDQMGNALDGRFDKLFQDPTNFKSIASGLGYGYEELEAIKNGEEVLDDEGNPITNVDELKAAMKKELFMQIEQTMPDEKKVVAGQDPNDPNEVAEFNKKQEELKVSALSNEFRSENPDFNQFIGKKITIDGFSGELQNAVKSGNNITITNRSGKSGSKKTFDITKPNEAALLQSLLTGTDYNLIKASTINKLKL